jgi:hypothetical protein
MESCAIVCATLLRWADSLIGFGVWLSKIIGFQPFKAYDKLAPDVRAADAQAHNELQVGENTMQQRKIFESCYQVQIL